MFSAFFFLTAVAIWTDLSKAEDCNFTDDFTGQYIIDQGNVRLEVCPDSFLKIDLSSRLFADSAEVNLIISDAQGVLVTFNSEPFDDTSVTLATRGNWVVFQGDGSWNLNVAVTEIPRVDGIGGDLPMENGTISLTDIDLAANGLYHYNLQGYKRLHLLDVHWNLKLPSAGFVSLSSTNGRKLVLSGRSQSIAKLKLALDTENGMSSLDVVTQNSLMDFSGTSVDVDYSVGDSVTSTEQPTTTTAQPIDMTNAVDLYLLRVNEDEFVNNDLANLKMRIEALASNYATTAGVTCQFHYSLARSCRERCFMTSEVDRGCVTFATTVDTDIFCSYTDDLLRTDLEDKELQKDWEEEFGIGRVSVGDCLSEQRIWLAVAVLIPLGTAVLFLAGILVTQVKRRVMRASTSNKMNKERSLTTSGSFGETSSLGLGMVYGVPAKKPAAVGRADGLNQLHFEVLVEGDDYNDY